ncbi:MAG: ABC transporter permease [Desulfurococcales archaeon]|jgi:putative spermidine/putrescine transport system permease protein|nr:ABC transporter permease [Desulfurococcales archaeon]
MEKNKWAIAALLLPTLSFIFFLLLGSILFTIISSFTSLKNKFIQVVSSEYFITSYLTTLKIGLVVVIASAALSYPLAIYSHFYNRKLSRVMDIMVFIPLMINPIIRSLGWMIILGKEGFINWLFIKLNIINSPLTILYTEVAVEIGLLELFFPFMYTAIASSMENIPYELIMSARSLGANSLRIFKDVIFPLSINGFMTGASLVMAGCAAAFVTPSILGGMKVRTLSIVLRDYVDVTLDWDAATIIAISILITVFGFIAGINLLRKALLRW